MAAASALVTSGTDCGEASVRALSEARASGDDVGRFVLTGRILPSYLRNTVAPFIPGFCGGKRRDRQSRQLARSKAPRQTPAKIRTVDRRRQYQRNFRSVRTRFEGQRAHAGPRRQHGGQLVELDAPRERGA